MLLLMLLLQAHGEQLPPEKDPPPPPSRTARGMVCGLPLLGFETLLSVFYSSSSMSDVEHPLHRLYAFDIHCNSFFPLFLSLYGGPLLYQPMLNLVEPRVAPSSPSCFFSSAGYFLPPPPLQSCNCCSARYCYGGASCPPLSQRRCMPAHSAITIT